MAGKRKTDDQPRAAKPCAHIECLRPALIRRKEKLGWADLCKEHYMEHLNDEAKDWLADNGLLREPGEPMKAWMARTLAWLAERKKPGTGMRRIGDILTQARKETETV